MIFSEDSRVKIPTILHLTRLSYNYLPKNSTPTNSHTNIFTEIFFQSIAKINQNITQNDSLRLLQDAKLSLENEDLGQAFYKKLTATAGFKLIDFENLDNNTFYVITELTYKNDEVHRSYNHKGSFFWHYCSKLWKI